jgi:hypothetical protein
VLDWAPAALPDVYAGAPVVAAVKLRAGELVVRGQTCSGEWSCRLRVNPPRPGEGSAAIAALFGRERVADLEARGFAGENHDAEIERIGLAFQIATRFTPFIAVDESRSVRSAVRHTAVPQELPYGTLAASFGLRAPGEGPVRMKTQAYTLAGTLKVDDPLATTMLGRAAEEEVVIDAQFGELGGEIDAMASRTGPPGPEPDDDESSRAARVVRSIRARRKTPVMPVPVPPPPELAEKPDARRVMKTMMSTGAPKAVMMSAGEPPKMAAPSEPVELEQARTPAGAAPSEPAQREQARPAIVIAPDALRATPRSAWRRWRRWLAILMLLAGLVALARWLVAG